MTVLAGAGWPRFVGGSLEGVDTCTSQGILGPLCGLEERVGSQDRAEETEQMQNRLRKGERRGQGPRRQGTGGAWQTRIELGWCRWPFLIGFTWQVVL